MTIVLDASYTIALALQEDEARGAAEVGGRLASEGALVPALWRFEVANVLLTAVRRKRIPAELPALILADLSDLPIVVDDTTADRAWGPTLALAERHRLTVYDASYLELALRHAVALASLDKALIAAARHEAVEIIGA